MFNYRTRITLAFFTGYVPLWVLGYFSYPFFQLCVVLGTALAAIMLAYRLLEPKEDRSLDQDFWDEAAMYVCIPWVAAFMALQVVVDVLKGKGNK